MNQQVAQFANTSTEIMQLLGPEAGANLIANSLFAVNMGSNDFLNNYFAPFSPIGNLSGEAVNSLILNTLEQQLTVTAYLYSHLMLLGGGEGVGYSLCICWATLCLEQCCKWFSHEECPVLQNKLELIPNINGTGNLILGQVLQNIKSGFGPEKQTLLWLGSYYLKPVVLICQSSYLPNTGSKAVVLLPNYKWDECYYLDSALVYLYVYLQIS